MKLFLFSFGYCTPLQIRNNKRYGYDDENSQALYILAPSSSDADTWGLHIACCMYKKLHCDSERSWDVDGYGYIVEEVESADEHLPVIKYGEEFDIL